MERNIENIKDLVMDLMSQPIYVNRKHFFLSTREVPWEMQGSADYANRQFYYIDKKFIKELEDQFLWIKANPNQPELKEKMQNVFVKADDNEEFLNSELGIKTFMEKVCSSDTDVIYLWETRGAGKTFTINYILNCHTEDLRGKRVFWIRANLFRIYSSARSDFSLSLKAYLGLKMLYVAIKYNNQEDNVTKEIIDYFTSGTLSPKLNNFLDENNYTKDDLDFMKSEAENIGFNFRLTPIKTDKVSLKIVATRDYSKDEQTRLERIYDLLVRWMISKNRKILVIIDGVDNVDYKIAWGLMKKAIRQIRDLRNHNVEHYHGKIVTMIIGRKETRDLFASITLGTEIQEYSFRLGEVPPSAILNKRKELLSKIGYKGKYADFLKFLENYVPLFANALKKIFGSGKDADEIITNLISGNNEEIVKRFYGGSHRDLLNDLIFNFCRIKDYVKEKHPDFFDEHTNLLKEELFNSDSILYDDKSYLVMEGTFTHGWVYNSPDKRKTFLYAHGIPNLLEDLGNGLKFFPYFLLRFMEENTGSNDLTDNFLEDIWKETVPKKEIENTLHVLREFGLIEIKKREDSHEKYYVVTDRGSLILRLYIHNLYLLHSMLISAKLPQGSNLRGGIASMFVPHKNNYSGLSSCMVRNTITFFRLLAYLRNVFSNLSKNIYYDFTNRERKNVASILENIITSSINVHSTITSQKDIEKILEFIKFCSSGNKTHQYNYDVFISYDSANDTEIAERLANFLRGQYFRVYLDRYYEAKPESALKESRWLIVINPHKFGEYPKREVTNFLDCCNGKGANCQYERSIFIVREKTNSSSSWTLDIIRKNPAYFKEATYRNNIDEIFNTIHNWLKSGERS